MRFITRLFHYFWASPTTAVGALFILPALLSGGRMQIVDGVLEIHGGLVALFLRRCTLIAGGASALTIGHIVLARDELCHDLTRSHERIHVRQCELWGPFFLPAYALGSLYALLRTRRPYLDNPFERQAYRLSPSPRGRGLG